MTDFWTNAAWLAAVLTAAAVAFWWIGRKVVADIDRAVAQTRQQPVPASVALLNYSNQHGDEMYVYATEEQAYAGIAEICRDNWESVAGQGSYIGTIGAEPPDDDDLAIQLYFDTLGDDEWYWIKVERVEGAGAVLAGVYADLTAADIECALNTLAEMHNDVEPADLSQRQIEVRDRVSALWSKALGMDD